MPAHGWTFCGEYMGDGISRKYKKDGIELQIDVKTGPLEGVSMPEYVQINIIVIEINSSP